MDNNPAGTIQYYRLRQVDINNHGKYSNIIILKGEKPILLSIAGLFPNPAVSVMNIQVSSPVNDQLTVVITDINGRPVFQKMAIIETGINSLPVDISRLGSGTYMVRLVSMVHSGSSVVMPFVKQ